MIKIATAYWDIPGTALLLDHLKRFLQKENTKVQILIGSDPVVRASQQKNVKYKGAITQTDFIRCDLQKLEVKCQNEGTNLVKFIEKANSAIKDNALVVVFTDDLKTINNALPGMKQRANVFSQIIVYGKSIDSLKASLADAQNTSVLSMTNYTKMSNDEISQVLLWEYFNWKKHR